MTHGVVILLADDDAIVRSALRLLVESEPGLRVGGEAGTSAEAVSVAAELQPDVVLLDMWMAGVSSVHAIPELLRTAPGASVVMLTSDDDPAGARSALAAGAAGFVLKRGNRIELASAINAVARGGRYVQPDMGARLAAGVPEPVPARDDDVLSEREREVLALIAEGLTSAEAAWRLGLSTRTVEAHRARIQHKLGLFGRSNLVRYARERDLPRG